MSVAEQYARWVLDPVNKTKTGRLIKLAAERFMSDLKRTDIFFDEKEAIKMASFCANHLVQWEGDWRGKPLIFEPWQRFGLDQLFGWIRKDTGTRRFTKFYLQISKKNGKSTECAGLAVFHVNADEKVNTPKVFTAANNEDQARICVNMAGRIIEQSPDLYELVESGAIKLFNYKDNITEIVNVEKDGFIKALSKEGSDKNAKTSGGKHGINASLGLVDEFGMAPDHGASGTVATSMAARLERLMAYFTTSGFNQAGPCFTELRAQGIKVLERMLVMDNYLPLIYEIDKPVGEDGKPKEITVEWLLEHEEVWDQSNPNLGVSVNKDYLREMLLDAKDLGGTRATEVLTLNFNVWLNSPVVFIPGEVWETNSHGLDESDLLGQECYGGIEIVSGRLLNAFCLLFPDVKGKTVIKLIFWMPEANRKNKETDNYDAWIAAGHIRIFLGDACDNVKVTEMLNEELSKYSMHSFAYKKNLENSDIVQELVNGGIIGNPISHGRDGISTPTKMWEEMLTAKKIEHFGNPVLAWMNANCLATRKDQEIRIEKSGSLVVGVYAAINALAQWKSVEAEGKMTNFDFQSL